MVKKERKNMTVKYYVEILYFDEYIVDFMDEMSAEYIEKYYPATYDSLAEYDIEIDDDERYDIVETIVNDTVNNFEYEIKDKYDMFKIVEMLEDEIDSEIDNFDFDADTELLTLKISIEYNGKK